jgi:signal peptidase I
LETLLLSAVLFLAINALSARVRVDGFSMKPTLQDGEFVLVNRLAYRLGVPQRGDIIVFHFPLDPASQDLIKRVIGLSGDRITVSRGVVYVNGEPLKEPYIAAPPMYNGEWDVPEGELFVLGDNRNDSSDSHSWGMLPMKEVVGKAIFIYWPFPEWKLIDHYDFEKVVQ